MPSNLISSADLARKLSCDISTVRSHAKYFGFPKVNSRYQFTPGQASRIAKRLEATRITPQGGNPMTQSRKGQKKLLDLRMKAKK